MCGGWLTYHRRADNPTAALIKMKKLANALIYEHKQTKKIKAFYTRRPLKAIQFGNKEYRQLVWNGILEKDYVFIAKIEFPPEILKKF